MILRGWESICAELGGMSEKTARQLARDEGLPVVIIAGRPTTTVEALTEWVEKRCQMNLEREK